MIPTIALPTAHNDVIKFFTFCRIVTEIGNLHHPSMLSAFNAADTIHSVSKLNMLIQVVMFTVILEILHGLMLCRECRRVWRKRKVTISHQLMWKVCSIFKKMKNQ